MAFRILYNEMGTARALPFRGHYDRGTNKADSLVLLSFMKMSITKDLIA